MSQTPKTKTHVEAGSVVAIYYTLTDASGKVLDTNKKGGKPLSFLAGAGNIVKGLDQGLIGAARGETRKVSVPPADGYGEWDEKLLEEIPRKVFPPDTPVEKGSVFHGRTPDGMTVQVLVHDVVGDKVRVDKNHPLAGKTLDFEVYVFGIREASDEEREHGHVHGPGGHHH